jgi:hypothetical protein
VATEAALAHSDELEEFGSEQELERRGVVFFGGLVYYWLVRRHKTGVLASHAFESSSPAVPDA